MEEPGRNTTLTRIESKPRKGKTEKKPFQRGVKKKGGRHSEGETMQQRDPSTGMLMEKRVEFEKKETRDE